MIYHIKKGKRVAPRIALLIIFFLIISSSYYVQGQDTDEHRLAIFSVANLSEDAESGKYRALVSEALEIGFKAAGFSVIPSEEWRDLAEKADIGPEQLVNGPVALKLARRLDADLAVSGFIFIEEGKIYFETKCYDVRQESLVTGRIRSGRVNLSLYNLIDRVVGELVPAVVESLETKGAGYRELKQISSVTVKEITLLSEQEGMEIFLRGGDSLGKVKDGKLIAPFLPVKVGSTLPVIKSLSDHHNDEQVLELGGLSPEISLNPLWEKSRYALSLAWIPNQFMGFDIGFRYYLDPDYIFLEADNALWMQYFFSGGRPVFHDDLRILFGTYLFLPYDSLFRLGFATGLGCIFTTMPFTTAPIFTDFYLNIASLYFELNFRAFSLFLRQDMKFTLGFGNDLLGRSFVGYGGGGIPSFAIGMVFKWK